MNPLFRIDFSISDSLKIVRKSVLIYDTIIHLGLHWGMILARFRQMFGAGRNSRIRRTVLRIVGVLTAGYGLHAFVTRDLATYMFLRTQFVFLDYNESPLFFYIDYLAMAGLFIWITHYLFTNYHS